MLRQTIKTWFRRVTLSAVAVLALLAAIYPQANTSVVKSADSLVPQFNFLPQDPKMMKGASPRDADFQDSVNAVVGDRVAIRIYYHNGVPNSFAHNTKIRVQMPAGDSNNLIFTGFVSSDETPIPVTDTLSVKLPDSIAAHAEFVPGSVKWFPNALTQWNEKHRIDPVSLPFGQDGNTITDGGVNIDTIQGCFEYAGYVSLLVDIKGQPNLSISKLVAKDGSDNFAGLVEAQPGETVRFKIEVKNTGTDVAKNVTVKDILPDNKLIYVPGSLEIVGQGTPSQSPFGDGVPFADMVPGQPSSDVVVLFKAQVNPALDGALCGTPLVNVAKLFLGGAPKGEASASVRVVCPPPITPNLQIQKFVWNPVKQVFDKSSTATVGDTISYQLRIKNTGNVEIGDPVVTDVIPIFTEYVPGSTRINAAPIPDSADGWITGNGGLHLGQILGHMPVGGEVIVEFRVKIKGCPPDQTVILRNVGFVKSQETGSSIFQDSVTTQVTFGVGELPL